jgi:predicted RND superfamily exporter protein
MLRCCSCKHKSKTHRRLGLPLARQLLQTGHLLVRSQIRVRHGDAVRVGVAVAVVMELLAVVVVMVVVMGVVLGAAAAVLVRVLMVLVLLVASVLWVLGVVVKACGNQDRGAHW